MTLGWECPRCGRCFSPSVSQCVACPVESAVGTSTWSYRPIPVEPSPCDGSCRNTTTGPYEYHRATHFPVVTIIPEIT